MKRWPDNCRHQCSSNLLNFRTMLTNVGQTWLELGHLLATIGHTCPIQWPAQQPDIAESGPNRGSEGTLGARLRASLGQVCSAPGSPSTTFRGAWRAMFRGVLVVCPCRVKSTHIRPGVATNLRVARLQPHDAKHALCQKRPLQGRRQRKAWSAGAWSWRSQRPRRACGSRGMARRSQGRGC